MPHDGGRRGSDGPHDIATTLNPHAPGTPVGYYAGCRPPGITIRSVLPAALIPDARMTERSILCLKVS